MRACAHPVPFTKLSPKEEGHRGAEEELGDCGCPGGMSGI